MLFNSQTEICWAVMHSLEGAFCRSLPTNTFPHRVAAADGRGRADLTRLDYKNAEVAERDKRLARQKPLPTSAVT